MFNQGISFMRNSVKLLLISTILQICYEINKIFLKCLVEIKAAAIDK